VGNDSHVVFGQKFPAEKGSVRWSIVMIQQPVLLSPEFRVKSFHAVAAKVTVVLGIDVLTCQDKFFVNNPLDVKK
jgi:hypothetical protein